MRLLVDYLDQAQVLFLLELLVKLLVITMEENLEDGSLILFLTFLHTSPLHKPLLAF